MVILSGLLFGIAAAVPIGPIGILAVTQRIRYGFARGYSGTVVASLMDILYSLIAIEAASFVTDVIVKYSRVMKFGGTAVLGLVSLGLLRQMRTFDTAVLMDEKYRKELHPVIASFFLYISAPTVLAFWLTAGGLAVAHGWVEQGSLSTCVFAVSCGVGSAVWYFILLKFILKSAERLKASVFRTIFLVLAVVLIVLAVFNVLSVWIKFPARFRIL